MGNVVNVMHMNRIAACRCKANSIRGYTGALGSPGFIAPETILGEPHTFAMDVFAVGVVLFVLLVGRKPFNISDSESLSYVHMDLEQCPGMQDPRWASSSKHLNNHHFHYTPAHVLAVCRPSPVSPVRLLQTS